MITEMIKSVLASKPIWLWGLTFSLLWLILAVFVFSQGVPKTYSLYFSGIVVSALIVWVFTNIISNISTNLIMSSTSLYYAFKFTKLTPQRYLLYYIISISIVTILMSSIVLIFSIVFFTIQFKTLLVPSSVLGFLGVIFLSSIFVITFSIFLALLLPPKYIQLSSLLPQVLYFVLVLGQIFIGYPYLFTYGSPFNDMELLLFQQYSGYPPPLSFINPYSSTLNTNFLLTSLVIWDSGLYTIDIGLLRRVKVRSVDEMRQF